MAKVEHYVACEVAYDRTWSARARRAGELDGFHGYPRQSRENKSPLEQHAYERGYLAGVGEASMNKHERRAYDAGAQARELDVPLDANPFEEQSNLGLWHAWGSGWNDADEAVKEAARPMSTGEQHMRQMAGAQAEMRQMHDRLIDAGFTHDGMDGYFMKEGDR